MQERWIADRAMLQRLMQLHPEWTQKELAAWIGQSVGWVKKWVKRFREAPPGDGGALLGKLRGRTTPYPQTDQEVQEHVIAIRDAPPENLKRVQGPNAILYYLARDPALQGRTTTLPRSTCTIWKILHRHGRIAPDLHRRHQPMERPAPMTAWQIDFKDASTLPADYTGKQQHVVDMDTSLVVPAQVHDDFQRKRLWKPWLRSCNSMVSLPRSPLIGIHVGSAVPVDAISLPPLCGSCCAWGSNPPSARHTDPISTLLSSAIIARSSRNVCWWPVPTPLSRYGKPTRRLCSITIRSGPIRRSLAGIARLVSLFPPCLLCHRSQACWTPMPGSATCIASTSFARCVIMATYSWMTFLLHPAGSGRSVHGSQCER